MLNLKSVSHTTDTRCVVRGGSWTNYHSFARCIYRNFLHPDSRYNYLGFRLFSTSIKSQPRRVVRGGSWSFNRNYARCAFRDDYSLPVVRNGALGFRLLCVSPSDPQPSDCATTKR